MAAYLKMLSVSILILAGTAGYVVAETGQGAGSIPRKGDKDSRKQLMDPAARLQLMSNGLKLTEEQQVDIKRILDDEERRRNEIRNDSSLSQEQIHAATRKIAQETHDTIKKLLTPDQRDKFEYKSRQMQKRREGAPAPLRPEEQGKRQP